MSLLDKFTDIKIDNSKRLPAEDMAHCKVEEELLITVLKMLLISRSNLMVENIAVLSGNIAIAE